MTGRLVACVMALLAWAQRSGGNVWAQYEHEMQDPVNDPPDVDHKGGWIETPLLKFSGKRLRLNIDTGAMGTAFVELRDEGGNPIPGFTLAECEEVGGNYIDQAVYWKGNHDLSALAGKPVRVYFKLTRAKLYSFVFDSR